MKYIAKAIRNVNASRKSLILIKMSDGSKETLLSELTIYEHAHVLSIMVKNILM